MSKNSLHRLNTRLSVLAVTLAIAGMPLGAHAAGLGRISVLSALGQPLRAEIELTASREELQGMVARVAAPDAFKLAGLDYANTLSALRFAIETRGTQSYVVLTSERPIRDPFVDMLIELNWSAGRMVREYTFLLDPPEMMAKSAAVPAQRPAMPAAPVGAAAAEPAKPPPAAPSAAASGAVPASDKRAVPAAETSVAVKRGDTLNAIAGAVKHDGVSLEQMLVGLYRANPEAFDGSNMNRLRAGAILTVPEAVEVAAIEPAVARREVRVQVADWNAYKRKLAGAASQMAAAEEVAGQRAEGKITPKVEAPAAPGADARDQVKVSKTQREAATAVAAGEDQKVAEARAVAEANARVAELERNVADLQKMLELKKQGAAAAPAPAAAASTPEKPVEAPAKPAEAAPATAAPPQAPAAAAAPTAAADEPVKPKPKAPPPPPPPPETSMVDDLLANPAALGGLAGLVALIGGWVAYRRRKATQAGEEGLPLAVNTLSPSSLGANSVFRATGGQSVDTSNVTPATTDFSQAGPGVIDTDEVDPVAEAEVYMAYGRDAQAEEILVEALAKDNKRVSIHLKLLEIYAARKSLKQFETLAGELYAVTGGAGPEWEKAAAMGMQLDAGNPVYSRGPSAANAMAAVSSAAVMPVADALATSVEPVAAPIESPEPAAADAGAFDFDLGIQALSGAAEPAADGSGYRFDFDFGGAKETTSAAAELTVPDDRAETGDTGPVTVAPEPMEAAASDDAVIALGDASADGLPAFDFDLGTPSTTATTGADVEDLDSAAPVVDERGLEFPAASETDIAPAVTEDEPADAFSIDFPETETETLASPSEPDPLPELGDVAEISPVAPVQETSTDDIALDFDLGFDADVVESGASQPLPDVAVHDALAPPGVVPDADPEPAEEADSASNEAAAMPKLNLAGLSLDLDAPEPAPVADYDAEATLFEPLADDEATAVKPAPAASEVADAFDLEALASDLPAAAPAPAADSPASEDPRWQEVGTKLDLAQAYEEMGDAEGARELLDEVLAEGSPAQQATAREMLARLG